MRFFRAIGIAIAVIALILGLNSYVIIQPGYAGIPQILGKVQEQEVFLEGFHFKWPLVESVQVYDTRIQKHLFPGTALTSDLQPLNADFVLNYRIRPDALVTIRRELGSLENIADQLVGPQTEEAFKTAAASRTAEASVTERPALKADFDHFVTSRLARYGIEVIDTAVVNIAFTEDFTAAVERKQVAEQDAQRAIYTAQQAEQQANARIAIARGEAESQRLQAESLKSPGGALVLQREAIEKWDGHFPQVMGGEGALPFINIGPFDAQ